MRRPARFALLAGASATLISCTTAWPGDGSTKAERIAPTAPSITGVRDLRALAFVLILAAASVGAAAHAADDMCFEKARNQCQMTACAAEALKRNDQELNRLYRQMEDRLKGGDKARQLLIDAERKWIGFRDAECTFTTVRTAGGSINAMNLNNCLAELMRNRVIALQNHLACGKGADEQTALECAVPR